MLVKGGKAIVPNVIEAVQIARQRGILVVWVLHSILPTLVQPSFLLYVQTENNTQNSVYLVELVFFS